MAGLKRIRKNDEVIVITGRDRGKRGRVTLVDAERNRVVVEGVNLIKRHTRPNPQKNIKGGILERESPIRLSNLAVICPSCGERTRVGSHVTDGEISRVCKKCSAEL